MGDDVLEVPSETLALATQIFAGLGYDNTHAETLTSAGIDPCVLVAAGGKPGLYRAVVRAAMDDFRAALDGWAARFTPDVAGVRRFVDDYLDYCIDHKHLYSLWVHRALADAADIADLEREHLAVVSERFSDIFRGSTRLDVQYAVLTIRWTVIGFTFGAVFDDHQAAMDPTNPAARNRFRAYMHDLVALMFPGGSAEE